MSDRDGGSPPDEDELADRLDDLEDALSELRAELDGGGRDPGPPRPPRPPRPSELLRFTERYTIPTVIALLEATIRSLELLRGAIRLADPGRELDDDDRPASTDRLDAVRGEASDRLAGSLRELRRALSAADLPSEPEARSIIEEARELSADVERRLDDDASGRAAGRGRGDRGAADAPGDDPVRIDVAGADDDGADPGDSADPADPPDDGADGDGDGNDDVDIEAELRTLRRQYRTDDSAGESNADPGPGSDSDSESEPDSDSESDHDASTAGSDERPDDPDDPDDRDA